MRTAVQLAGAPTLWFGHFLLVYLVVEAGCGGDVGDDPVLLGLSPLALFTVAATVVAAAACLALGAWSFRRTDATDPGGGIALSGLLLGALFALAILLVGLPALWTPACE